MRPGAAALVLLLAAAAPAARATLAFTIEDGRATAVEIHTGGPVLTAAREG